MKTKNEILNLGVIKGSIVLLDYFGMEVVGIIDRVEDKEIIFTESVITKEKRLHNVWIRKPSLKENERFLLSNINHIELLKDEDYTEILSSVNLESKHITECQFGRLISSLIKNKENLKTFETSVFSKENALNHSCVKFKIKTNPTKSNWCHITLYSSDNCTQLILVLTSEYFDKTKNENKVSVKEEYIDTFDDKGIDSVIEKFESLTGLIF